MVAQADIPEQTSELDLLAERIALPMLEKIRLLERATDELVARLSWSKSELLLEKNARATDIESYIKKVALLQEEKAILQEQIAELLPRPKEHQHDPDDPLPVICLDLDGTIKPQIAKGGGGNFPLTDKYSDPFPGVKEWLERWKSRGACIHLATSGLYYHGPADLELYKPRLAMIEGWYKKFGLPIDIVLPNIPSDCYYDDRMVEVPGDPSMKEDPRQVKAPDWDEIGEFLEKDLSKRFELNEYGVWQRKDKHRIGKEIENWPDGDIFKDRPRGYSGPSVDVDLHRTLSSASSSLRIAPPRPDAVECMKELYQSGITLTVSCAGWNPKTHSPVDSIRRLAGIRQWLQLNCPYYDRVSAKDHADAYINDKGIRWTGWKQDLPRIYKKLPQSIGFSD